MSHSAVFSDNEEKTLEYLREKSAGRFEPGDRVAIKLHMGEPGNKYYIKAEFTSKIVDILIDIGCSPFIFDSPVMYRSPRGSEEGYIRAAAEHGYTEENMKVPVIISDRSTPKRGKYSEYEVTRKPLEADGVLLLTHFKGHVASGMGGSVKNVGMGCMSKATKEMIHRGGEPVYADGCIECGICVENCPTGNIEIREGRPFFDQSWCPGCSNCVLVCPENAIEARLETFGRLIADAACTAHQEFRKVLALNVMKNITRLCDCIASSGPIILDDVGYIVADDMLSADIASLKMVEEHSGKKDLFKEHNLTSGWDHINEAADIMGRDIYIDIN
ncbi:MAG: DUF362 domain-containing protein, partial [Candidatus Latescibacteria bacterium]|nr:DUF362 domain-containing protein [bacterium]MBD3424678.1 DUF362 domain-containing protein [Candidatus Latescibacterota bacterium]